MDIPGSIILLVAVLVAIAGIIFMLNRSWGDFPTRAGMAPAGDRPGAGSADTGGTDMFDKDVEREVREILLKAPNNKIAAIKRVRELTDVGLKEAKDYVEALQSRMVPRSRQGAGPRARRPDAQVEREIRALLQKRRGNQIEAIRRVMELTGMGLKEAKDYVDSLLA